MTHVLYRCYSDNGRLLYVGPVFNVVHNNGGLALEWVS